MHDIQHATIDALGLLLSGDRQLWSIVLISLSVSLRAIPLRREGARPERPSR